MDGRAAVEFYRLALLRVLAGLFDAAGFAPGDAPLARMPQRLRKRVLRVLLSAESATKRLIVFVSHRVELPPAKERVASSRNRSGNRKSGVLRAASFWLFDKRKFFPELADKSKRVRRGPGPRIIDLYNYRRPVEPEKPVRDSDNAVRLSRRMQALHRALSDLDAQAIRLLRLMENRKNAPPGPGSRGPIRPGYPPGRRKNKTHEVDGILHECHVMAVRNKAPPMRGI